MDHDTSGLSTEDVRRYASLKDPSTVTVMDSENLGGGVETGSTGERDMHSDATSRKHAAPSHNHDDRKEDKEGRKEDSFSGSGTGMVSDMSPVTEASYGGGIYGSDSTPSLQDSGHASDFQSAEGLASDMPDRKRIHEPPSSGDRATDITGISYIQ